MWPVVLQWLPIITGIARSLVAVISLVMAVHRFRRWWRTER